QLVQILLNLSQRSATAGRLRLAAGDAGTGGVLRQPEALVDRIQYVDVSGCHLCVIAINLTPMQTSDEQKKVPDEKRRIAFATAHLQWHRRPSWPAVCSCSPAPRSVAAAFQSPSGPTSD